MSKGPISFTFDGRRLAAQPGDTLAAALLRNGIRLVGRSFKYHRPRGILSAGVEEPNALVTVGEGGRREPNTRATDLFVYDGMAVTSQNRWPTLSFDLGAVIGLFSKALPAGFYYKTFFGPAWLWLIYEWFIRRAAGLGNAPDKADPDRYSQRAAFCDVLVIGGGPAGLGAALEAAEAGKRVILAEQDHVLGASLIRDPQKQDQAWVAKTVARIRKLGGLVLTRTSGSGYWEHDLVTLTQLLAEPGQTPPEGTAQRLWHVRAKQVVLATGAIERPLAFANNDLPGIMLSQAVRTYVRRFGICPGRRAIIATTNDDGYATAHALREAGAEIVAILDSRPAPAGQALTFGLSLFNQAHPVKAMGTKHGITGLSAQTDLGQQDFSCDLLAMAGGFTPTLHLHMQAGGALEWDETAQAFVPGRVAQNVVAIGDAAGTRPADAPAARGDAKKSFVDFQNDVTLADIDLAWREGYRSVEHIKRYTTLGMATDQGKLGNLPALTRLAQQQDAAIPAIGTTRFRPPYTPVTMGLLAGRSHPDAGAHHRRIALHDLHLARNPIWQQLGYWERPRAYPAQGENLAQAALREARCVRDAMGLCDVSTLGKFEVCGPDAAELLERVCATSVARLAIGRGRYTFMLAEDGFVIDDGTVWRLDENRYFLTSSTGGADRMAAHLSYVRQVLFPQLRVCVVNVQEHYAGFALAGPQAASTIASLCGRDAPPHMGLETRAMIAGHPVLILAASYSGERAFEIHTDASHAAPVWHACEAAVLAGGGCLYGLEAMELLRIEKGHVVVGGEVDKRSTPRDLGLEKMLNKAGGYVGEAGLSRPALQGPGRLHLVGLEAIEGSIPEGSMLVAAKGSPAEGHVTASGLRVADARSIALALLRDGRDRQGAVLLASSPTRGHSAQVRVVSPHFYDPAGERYRD